jgi:hypothetical protein
MYEKVFIFEWLLKHILAINYNQFFNLKTVFFVKIKAYSYKNLMGIAINFLQRLIAANGNIAHYNA